LILKKDLEVLPFIVPRVYNLLEAQDIFIQNKRIAHLIYNKNILI